MFFGLEKGEHIDHTHGRQLEDGHLEFSGREIRDALVAAMDNTRASYGISARVRPVKPSVGQSGKRRQER